MGVLTKCIFLNCLVAFASSKRLAPAIAEECYKDYISVGYDAEKCCGPNSFPCRNGHCISESSFCNGRTECADHSDEGLCSVEIPGEEEFLREDQRHRTTSERTIVDCSYSEFQCKSKKCVTKYDVCNGKQDCDDGSDEDNCRFIWRNYNGTVPESAIVAWKSGQSEAFIGRTSFYLGVLVNQIIAGENRIKVTATADPEGNAIHVREDKIDIMCSDKPENFVWLSVNLTYMLHLRDQKVFDSFVYGGQEIIDDTHSYDLYICRLHINGQYIVGKVSSHDYLCWFPNNGKQDRKFDYEILTYKESKTKEAKYDPKESENEIIVKTSTDRNAGKFDELIKYQYYYNFAAVGRKNVRSDK